MKTDKCPGEPSGLVSLQTMAPMVRAEPIAIDPSGQQALQQSGMALLLGLLAELAGAEDRP